MAGAAFDCWTIASSPRVRAAPHVARPLDVVRAATLERPRVAELPKRIRELDEAVAVVDDDLDPSEWIGENDRFHGVSAARAFDIYGRRSAEK